MNRNLLRQLIAWSLPAVSVVILLFNIPSDFSAWLDVLIYGSVMVFTLYYGVHLSVGRISPAHIISMIAVLTASPQAQPLMLWGLALASGVGAVLIVLGVQASRYFRVRGVALVITRVVLAQFLGLLVYRWVGGPLPLTPTEAANLWTIWALALFGTVLTSVFFAVYALQTSVEGRNLREALSKSRIELLATLLVPLPFAVIAAALYHSNFHPATFYIMLGGMTMAIWGLHLITATQSKLRRQLDELRTLAVVTQAMRSQLNLDTLLKTVYLQVSTLLDIKNFTLALYNNESTRLQFPLVFRDGQQQTVNNEQGLVDYVLLEYVLNKHTPLLIGETQPSMLKTIGLSLPTGVLSWLGVPLIVGERVLGALVVTRDNSYLTADDLRLLNIVASSASIAVENVQLYEQQTTRINQLAMLNNITYTLTGTLARETVLDAVMNSALKLAGAQGVAVYLFAEGSQTNLTLVRSSGMGGAFINKAPEPLLMAYRHSIGTDQARLQNTPPVLIRDVNTDQRTMSWRTLMAQEQKVAWIELPLAVGYTDMGVLGLYYATVQMFSGELIELFRTFATQAAQSINNARLFTQTDAALERRVEQLYALASMGRLVPATMEISMLGELVLNYATDATKTTNGIVIMRDEATHQLTVIAHSGYPANAFDTINIETQGLTRRVFANAQAVRVADVYGESDYVSIIPETRSQMTVPLLRGREVLGAITLESPQRDAFSDEDVNFIAQLASQVVIAIDNLTLFRRITEALNRLQVLLDTMEEAILLIDNSGTIALANPRVSLLGLTVQRVLGRQIAPQKSPTNKGVTAQLNEDMTGELSSALGFDTKDDLRTLVSQLQHKDNALAYEPLDYITPQSRAVRRQIIAIQDNDTPIGALLIFYDRTQERELAQAREDLSRMIVHDLRSPLAAVTASLKLMRDVVPQDVTFRPMIDTATQASQRAIKKLLSRVDSLLDVAKMESGEIIIDTEPTVLNTVADNVIAELQPLAHELEISLIKEIPADLPLLMIDADKVERLLLNLVDNALKYTPMNTTITIKASPPDALGFSTIAVIDQGPGVPDEYKARLFDRFVQIKGRESTRGGVGLGLAFCKLVAEAHGGRIWVADNVGGGSIFACLLPIMQTKAFDE
jgi:signal transduction histidine kinase